MNAETLRNELKMRTDANNKRVKTDHQVDDRVTVTDHQSELYGLNGTVGRVHKIKGEIFYDVCLPHRNGIGGDSRLLRSNQLCSETNYNPDRIPTELKDSEKLVAV